MTAMKMVFTTACIASPENVYWLIHWLKDSCDRFKVPLKPYGISPNAVFAGWVDIKVDKFVEAARGWMDEGYTHVFYTDGRDSFMLCGVEEVIEKYTRFGRPPYLISCEDQAYPRPELGAQFPDPGHPWRYLGAGQFVGEIAWMVEMWADLRRKYSHIESECHDQGWLQLGYVNNDLNRSEFILDTECQIFQCVREHLGKPLSESQLEVRNGRIYNTITNTWPCALHFAGGYSDPVTGKDDVLRAAWKELGL